MRVLSHAALLLATGLPLAGCVTGGATPSATTAAAAGEDAPVIDETPELVSEDVQPVSAEAATAGEPSLDWQQTLTSDVDAVESKGDAFLDTSFHLYDQLLDNDAAKPEKLKAITATLNDSVNLYADLTAAVDRLHTDLGKPEIKSLLPLTGDDGKREYDAVAELFASYKPTQKHTVAYDGNTGSSVTMLLFNDKDHGDAAGLGDLPKPQRDALTLLDELRQISNDLAYVSHTVTDWVDVREHLGSPDDEYAH